VPDVGYTCGEGGRAAMVRAGEGGNRPPMGEQEVEEGGSECLRFGTAIPAPPPAAAAGG
jgi:hypothetical protein